MRGLRSSPARRAVMTRAALICAAVAALGSAAACSAGGMGARDEGPARTAPYATPSTPPSSPPSSSASVAPAPTARIDGVKLVMSDPRASIKIKKELRPCDANGYPVDVSYGSLTDSPGGEVVVNVMTCDAISLGTYVYRPSGESDGARYEDIFREEESPVYATIDRGDLVVRKKVYERDDEVAYPSGEDVIVYRWSRSTKRFAEQTRTHNDYSRAVGEASPTTGDK
ncbi:hypothetical protein [Streptomyces sp. NPDC050560]|uniref:hypothetical protein n=1 Tax=Streptomyces sp. NPDC050560 TaxID=3365630 RepID=UPI003794DCC4